jgi:hypothetical protein
VPWVSTEAAEANRGKSIDEQSAAAAGTAAVSKARPLSQNAYKVKLTSVAVKRALLLAAGQTNATRFRRRKGYQQHPNLHGHEWPILRARFRATISVSLGQK